MSDLLRDSLKILPTLVAVLLLAVLPNPAAADRCPCGDLLLPWFEVALPEVPEADPYRLRTVTLAVGNRGGKAEEVFLTVHTNWGIPVIRTRTEIPGHGVFSANLRNWLLFGQLPDRQMDPEELAHVQAALLGEPSPRDGLYYGTAQGGSRAVGYVTATVSRLLSNPRTLWGDFFAIDPVEEDAAGESMVRLVQDETREVCRQHLVRFLEGGAFDGHTRFLLWTGVRGWPSRDPEPAFPRPTLSCRAWSEDGRLLREFRLATLATQALPAADLGLGEPFGWMECDTDTLAFMATQHEAHSSLDLALRSFCLAESGDGPGPGPGPGPGEPSLVLQKLTNGEDADEPPGPVVPVGDPVTWLYEVTNDGEAKLFEVAVVDAPPADVVCPAQELAVGETMTCQASGTTEAGQFHNLATVTAVTGSDPPETVEASDPSHYFGEVPGVVAVGLEKLTNGQDADEPPGPTLTAGETVMWTYTVTNTGELPLHTLSVVDSPPVTIHCPRPDLDPGQGMTCTAQGVAAAGPFANLATVTGFSEDGRQAQATDPSHYTGLEPGVAAVDLEKSTNEQDADLPPGPTLTEGSEVFWTYAVTNTGEVALTQVQVVDSPPQQIQCPGDTLQPGEGMTCTASGIAIAGPYENVATVTAVADTGVQVEASDPSHYTGETPPPPPPPPGDQGCTPGYWKNHACAWTATGYATDQLVSSVFPSATHWPALGSSTLLAALDFGGGPGAEGAAKILLRAGVAALLNAAHPDVAYPRSASGVLMDVDAALDTGSREGMLLVATALDAANNLGCPLDNCQSVLVVAPSGGSGR